LICLKRVRQEVKNMTYGELVGVKLNEQLKNRDDEHCIYIENEISTSRSMTYIIRQEYD
jgi:hypothetical protein